MVVHYAANCTGFDQAVHRLALSVTTKRKDRLTKLQVTFSTWVAFRIVPPQNTVVCNSLWLAKQSVIQCFLRIQWFAFYTRALWMPLKFSDLLHLWRLLKLVRLMEMISIYNSENIDNNHPAKIFRLCLMLPPTSCIVAYPAMLLWHSLLEESWPRERKRENVHLFTQQMTQAKLT